MIRERLARMVDWWTIPLPGGLGIDPDVPDPFRAAAVDAERRIYIASKAKHGPRWQALREQGHPIISTWIDESAAFVPAEVHLSEDVPTSAG